MVFDSNFNFSNHVSQVIKSTRVNAKDLYRSRPFLDLNTSVQLANARTKSYAMDTQHFISRLKQLGEIPEGVLLVTLNVSSLYTNIMNHEGILAAADHLRTDKTKQNT